MYSPANKASRGQSMLEYAVFLCVVLSALLVMQFIVKRSYQGRIKQEADSVGPTYSPGHTASNINTTVSTTTTTYTGGSIPGGRAIDEGMIVSLSTSSTSFDKEEGLDLIRDE